MHEQLSGIDKKQLNTTTIIKMIIVYSLNKCRLKKIDTKEKQESQQVMK
jgi:hypothetical protein